MAIIFTLVLCMALISENSCQLLDTFVAPVLDNQNAPIVARINTSDISVAIVKSLENPILRFIDSKFLQMKFEWERELKFEWERELSYVTNRLSHLEDQGSSTSTFYFAVLKNYEGGKDRRALIYIASDTKGQCAIEVPFLNMNKTLDIDIGLTKFEISSSIELAINGIEKKAIKVTCDVMVQLYAINREYHTTDGMLALPLSSLSNYYLAPSYTVSFRHVDFSSEIGIVSTEDNTYLNITLGRQCTEYSYEGDKYTAGDVISLKLDEFQTFQMISYYDLSGTMIRSSKPVAVISGNQLLLGGSHGSEMIIPVKNFGLQYIIPQLYDSTLTKCRLFSTEPATINITYTNGINEVARIKDTMFIERKCNQTESVYSTSPVMVVLYATGHDHPFMTLVPGTHQYDYTYNIAVFDSNEYPFTSYLTVMTPVTKNIQSDIQIEGLSYEMKNIQKVFLNHLSYTTFTISIREGYHKVYSKSKTPFGLIIFGDGVNDGYGYPAGIKLY